MKIYTTTNSLIVKSIQSYFNVINKEVKTIVFSDGEVLFQLNDELVDETIILIQTISAPVNDAIIHTLFLTELIKNACVKNIILVLTYLGYARQDRQTLKFSLVSSKVVCKLLSNVNRVYVIEPHCSHVLSYFDSSSFGISIASIICEHISRFYDLDDIVIISLDQGGLNRVIKIANSLGVKFISAIKRRINGNIQISLCLEDKITESTAIIIDDIIDTGKSIKEAISQLNIKFKNILVYCVHALLSKVQTVEFKLVSSNSIVDRQYQLDVSYLLSRIIKNVLKNKEHNELL